ncbi:MAG: hypothetical protein U0944_03855, partial [Candidatus Moranbacteria bacterium]|nr:hypothetical protein [Candidatus Moranbacteria bacterium]
MLKKQNVKKNISKKITALIAIFSASLFLSIDKIYGATSCDSANDRVECLEKERKDTQKLIDIKNKTQLTIQSQLSFIDAQQQKNQAELLKTKEKAQSLAQ